MAKIILNVDLQSGNAEKELAKFKKSIQGLGDQKGIKNIDNLRKGYANLINTIQGAEKNYSKGTFSKILQEAKDGLNNLKDPAHQTTEGLNNLDKTLKKLQADFAETRAGATNFKGTLKDLVLGFGKFQLAAMLVMKPLQLLQQEFEHLNEVLEETESKMVEIRRVAGESANSDEIYSLAIKYSEEFANVADVVERFAKAGYSWEDSLKAAESALTAMKVAELDSEQATEGLIAVMKQFGLEVSDLNDLVDMLNKTADNYAVDTEELLIALQKTGSTAKNAGLDVKETIGLITALSEGTAASGQNIGNALRSLFVFTSDDKALDTFAGMSAGMEKVVKDFRSGKASILDVWYALGNEIDGKQSFKNAFGGVNMSEDMEAQLTQIEDQLAEIYGTAGNYRQNYFIALLDNIETSKKAIEDTRDAANYSQKELNEELKTYENMVASLNAKWEKILNNEQGFLGFKKGLVEAADKVLTMVEALQWLADNASLPGIVGKAVAPLQDRLDDLPDDHWFNLLLPFIDGSGWLYAITNVVNKKAKKESGDIKSAIGGAIQKIESDQPVIENTYLSIEKIVEKLKEARDATKETYDYEEKKKAVLEAEKALLDAQKNRTTLVFNEELGIHEFVANDENIRKAQEELEEARKAVEEAAYNEIISELEEGNKSGNALLKIVSAWAEAYGSGDFSGVSNTIRDILGEAGVFGSVGGAIGKDMLLPPKNGQALHAYAGGVMASSPLSTLIPHLLDRPSNNNVSNVDSHDISYQLNGVPISSGMASMSLSEIFTVLPSLLS